MRIAILDASPATRERQLAAYLAHLAGALRADGHEVTALALRGLDIHTCIGCLDCFVRTPGECSRPDDFARVCRAAVNADFVLWASPLSMGFPSALLKMALERLTEVSLHPYGEVVNDEVHHRPRYDRHPAVGLLLAREDDTDAEDIHLVADIIGRSALAVQNRLAFVLLADAPIEDVVSAVTVSPTTSVPVEQRPGPTIGVGIVPPGRLTVFNGSPRGRRSNTIRLLDPFLRGFTANPGRSFEIIELIRLKDAGRFPQAFADAECVLLGFPLYADSMPGIVKAFIESLGPLRGRVGSPPIGFLVQGGFPEATHARHVERYLEKLAARLGSPYLGTIVKGGCEMLRERNALHRAVYDALFLNWGMLDRLFELGRSFGATGRLDPVLLRRLARLERYPGFLMPVLRRSGNNPLINHYWNAQLRRHGAFARRSATPYAAG